MSEASSGQAASADADATPGTLLRRERERASLTVQQAAEDLHLDTWIIEAIEADRFLALGAPVYAKGHLRKYATRLGLSADDVLARYEALQDRPLETDPIPTAVAMPIRPPRRSLKGPAWIALAIVVLAAVGFLAFEWLATSSTATPPAIAASRGNGTVEPPPVEPPNNDSQAAAALDTPYEAALTANDPIDTSTAAAAASEVPPTSSAASTAASEVAPISIRLEFTGESWTEIYDATGARLLFGMGTPKRVRSLVGVPPLQVNLGAASAVNLQVNGESVVIPRREGRESARFTIDADGNLR